MGGRFGLEFSFLGLGGRGENRKLWLESRAARGGVEESRPAMSSQELMTSGFKGLRSEESDATVNRGDGEGAMMVVVGGGEEGDGGSRVKRP